MGDLWWQPAQSRRQMAPAMEESRGRFELVRGTGPGQHEEVSGSGISGGVRRRRLAL